MQNHIRREEANLESAPIHNHSNHTLTKNFQFSSKAYPFFLRHQNFQTRSKYILEQVQIMHGETILFSQQHSRKATTFKEKIKLDTPPSDNHTLISFFTRVWQELVSINTPRQKTTVT